MKKGVTDRQAIILLMIMIAIGGIVLYGQGEPSRLTEANKTNAPK